MNILPLIRKCIPALIAADIVGVQPMTHIFDTRRKMIASDELDEHGVTYYYVTDTGNDWHSAKAGRALDEREWCWNTFGPSASYTEMDPTYRWQHGSDGKFKFRYEEDRTMFILRWDGTE